MIVTGIVWVIIYLLGLSDTLNSGGLTALNVFLFTGLMGFFGSIALLSFARFFRPGPRKWCRRLVWVLWIAGLIAFGAFEMIHPWNGPDMIEMTSLRAGGRFKRKSSEKRVAATLFIIHGMRSTCELSYWWIHSKHGPPQTSSGAENCL